MPLASRPAASLRSVRLHGDDGDTLRARQRLERALAEVDWSPPGLSPHAFLFVRKLTADGRRGIRPQSEGGAFGRSVSAALRGHAAAARRPWLHDDAAQADAVVFVDESELLACLWRDWARGTVPQRWWWRCVLGGQDPLAWLRLKAWPRAEWLVPALALLAERRDAVTCVARLEARDAERALQAVQAAYGLVHLGESSAVVPSGDQPTEASSEPDRALSVERGSPPSTALRRLLSRVPELSASHLAPAQRRLLAVALGVMREPAWARTPAFAAAVGHRALALAAEVAVATPPQRVEPRDAERLLKAGPRPRGVFDATPTSPPTSPPNAATQQSAIPTTDTTAVVTATTTDTTAAVTATAADATRDAQPPAASITATFEAVPVVDALPVAAPVSPPRLGAAQATVGNAAHAIRTRYGGLFYLLNAALALRVYGDFTMPRHPGLALSPWDLMAWTGRAWFGDELLRDPLWPLLATLSGRQLSQPPGHGFDAPPDWRIDPAWLAPWGTDPPLGVHATRQRLRVLHPQGFALFDVARDTTQTPLLQARALCGGQTLRRATQPFARVPRRADARWLAHWLAYLNARLRHTLDTDTDIPALLCRHDAEVRIDAGHVDIHLALHSLPLSVRFAGLDRDPGWIPAAGRSLSFHFK